MANNDWQKWSTRAVITALAVVTLSVCGWAFLSISGKADAAAEDVTAVSKRVSNNDARIRVLERDVTYQTKALERLEDKFGTSP